MCMYLSNANFLGQRLIGYEFFDSKSMGFIGFSEKQVIDKINHGDKVYGLKKVKKDEESGKDVLELDVEGFNMTNLQVKSGVNNLTWLVDTDNNDMNIGLIVVSVSGDKKKVYETINARHARVSYTEEKLKMLMELGAMVAGVKLEKNKLVVCEGVEILTDEKKENE